jgi:hypothetical protein
MITSEYVSRAMTGVFRLSLHDAKGLSLFEMTADGFFRSFWAIAFAAPLYAYALLGTLRAFEAMPDAGGKTVSVGVFVGLHALNFLGGCVLFLVAMIPLSRMLELSGRYTTFAVAYNWGTLAIHAIAAVPALAFGVGLINAADAVSFALVALGFGFYLRFASFSVTLGAPWPIAASLALTEALVNWVWWLSLTSFI